MSRKRLLIVDDEVDLVEMLSLRLQAQGRWDIEAAYDGDEGLEKARADHPDIVLLDTVMPKVDGWEVCRQLRSDPGTRDAKIIVMTAAGTGAEAAAREAGADLLVRKPYEFSELLGALSALEGPGSSGGRIQPRA